MQNTTEVCAVYIYKLFMQIPMKDDALITELDKTSASLQIDEAEGYE